MLHFVCEAPELCVRSAPEICVRAESISCVSDFRTLPPGEKSSRMSR